MKIGKRKHFGKLLSQAKFHLVFDRIDTVFRQAAGFHVTVEDHSFVSSKSEFLGGEESGGSGADYEDSCQSRFLPISVAA
jgi:hypothetical protein